MNRNVIPYTMNPDGSGKPIVAPLESSWCFNCEQNQTSCCHVGGPGCADQIIDSGNNNGNQQ
jgi:hypothetical protein